MPNTSPDAANPAKRVLRVGDWLVHSTLNEVRRGDEAVRLEPKAIEVLVHLAGKAGAVVGREELLSAVWPGVVVGDDALTQAIAKLRKALGDEAHQPRYIETISKRGYRLLAPVTHAPPDEARTVGDAKRGSPSRRRAIRLAAAAGILIAVAMAIRGFPEISRTLGLGWPLAATDAGPAVAMPVIAVLPLANLSGDASRDYFSDGVTEDIITALGRFSSLRVLSRNAVEPYRNRAETPKAVRGELGARYVLQGSFRESGGRIRVVAELSDAEKGIVIWSDRYEGEGRDVFDIQDRIVTNIVGVLAVKVSRVEQERASSRPVENLEAHDLVLRARALIYRVTRDTNRQARELLARAVQLQPDYAEAYVALAHAEYRRADQGWVENPEEGMRRAEAYARKALGLDDKGAHARAHAQLSRIHSQLGDLDQALAESDRAIALNPSDAVALYSKGTMLVWLGRTEEAIGVLETVRRFDPSLDDIVLPLAYYLAGRYRDAVTESEAAIARSPEVALPYAVRAAALGRLGLEDQAKDAVARLRRVAPFSRAELFGSQLRDRAQAANFHDGLRSAGLTETLPPS